MTNSERRGRKVSFVIDCSGKSQKVKSVRRFEYHGAVRLDLIHGQTDKPFALVLADLLHLERTVRQAATLAIHDVACPPVFDTVFRAFVEDDLHAAAGAGELDD